MMPTLLAKRARRVSCIEYLSYFGEVAESVPVFQSVSTPKVPAKPQENIPVNTTVSNVKNVDVDLRQLPAVIGKKRSSTETPDQGIPKKSKIEIFDKLFGDEDTDLRQLPITIERPPTPPPPIISSSDAAVEEIESSRTALDAVRAKLANATNREKIMAKSFNKKKMYPLEDQDLRTPKPHLTSNENTNKIIISPEDENCIKSGTLTKEQETHLLNKIILQMEKNKLKEAKKKDHEESFNISLQPISDDELLGSDEEKNVGDNIEEKDVESVNDDNIIPFNDIDERHHQSNIQQKNEYVPSQFHSRDIRDLRMSTVNNWRGRGGRRYWDNQTAVHPRLPNRSWNQLNSWRNLSPNFPSQHEFVPVPHPLPEEEAENQDMSLDQLTNGAVNQDEIKTINIDGLPKDIRFYDETAIVFINWDEPREISFQDGVRHIIFNDTDSYLLGFNKPYQEIIINGLPHKVRLGAPSREIFIDQVPYECYFGSAGIRIDLNGVTTTVKLEGPPPQVKIGDYRTDLVAGKINLFINAKIVVPVFLDSKVQKFMIEGETSTLKFVNALQTVLINDIPFSVEYGGLPKPIIIHGKKHFIRFSVLPKGIKPGNVVIKEMEGECNINSPENASREDLPTSEVPDIPPLLPDELDQVKIDKSPERTSNSPNVLQQNLNNLDVLSNVMTPSIKTVPTTGGYQIQNDSSSEDTKSTNSSQVPVPLVPQTLNINDLFQKLVASGFVTSGIDEKSLSLPSVNKEIKIGEGVMQNPESSSNHSIQVKPVRKSPFSNIKQITFTKPDTLKVRQTALYSSLYAGMQCSSCGMRFSPEASMHYSQHLDWHFRQNRKGKKNIRVATSRKWYYSLSDWKNYEELEDLEEREKNYFDQQQQAENVGDEVDEDVDIPSVPADPDTTNECCDVCRDVFDQFFNEEKEEWHLRNAIRIDDKTYHPVCYNDFKQSLNEDSVNDSKIEESTEEEEKAKDLAIPGLEIIIDDDEDDSQKDNSPISTEVVSLESDESKTQAELPKTDNQEGDDDDVILNEIAPIKIIVEDDDDDNQDHGLSINHSVAIKEEKLDDGFLEVAGLVSLQNGGQIKIKAEPVDPDEVTLISQMEMDEQRTSGLTSDGQPKRQLDEDRSTEFSTVTHPELVTSIDGNVEIIYSTSGTVTSNTVSSNKIKINISKPLPAMPSKEKETTSESDYPTDTYVDPSEPFPPGEEPEPLKLKPTLKGVKLKKLPPIKRGTELTGLCSIM